MLDAGEPWGAPLHCPRPLSCAPHPNPIPQLPPCLLLNYTWPSFACSCRCACRPYILLCHCQGLPIPMQPQAAQPLHTSSPLLSMTRAYAGMPCFLCPPLHVPCFHTPLTALNSKYHSAMKLCSPCTVPRRAPRFPCLQSPPLRPCAPPARPPPPLILPLGHMLHRHGVIVADELYTEPPPPPTVLLAARTILAPPFPPSSPSWAIASRTPTFSETRTLLPATFFSFIDA